MSHSDSGDEVVHSHSRLFGRTRPLHELLGGGKVADIVLWRDKSCSGAILICVTMIWFLFEVVGYHFFTLVCHISITTMLLVFIWSNSAALFNRDPPRIPEVILSEQLFREMALSFHSEFNKFVFLLHEIACGRDLRLFLFAIVSLWLLSAIGSCCSALNLLYFGLLCIQTLPALYERYEEEVDHLATKGIRDLKKLYKKLDAELLSKIPRGQVKKME